MASVTTAANDKTGSNLTSLKKEIAEAVGKIEQHKIDRTNSNEEIAAIKSNLAAKGIHKKALDMAMTYMNMDTDKREGFDLAYDIVREAIGLPVSAQGDLFIKDGKGQGEESNG